MFYKIIHHVVAIHPLDTLLLPTTTITRYNNSHTYQHIRTDKDSYKYSFYPRTIIQWNLLPIHVHEAVTVDAFGPCPSAHPNFKLGADSKSSIAKECRITKKKKTTPTNPLCQNRSKIAPI